MFPNFRRIHVFSHRQTHSSSFNENRDCHCRNWADICILEIVVMHSVMWNAALGNSVKIHWLPNYTAQMCLLRSSGLTQAAIQTCSPAEGWSFCQQTGIKNIWDWEAITDFQRLLCVCTCKSRSIVSSHLQCVSNPSTSPVILYRPQKQPHLDWSGLPKEGFRPMSAQHWECDAHDLWIWHSRYLPALHWSCCKNWCIILCFGLEWTKAVEVGS